MSFLPKRSPYGLIQEDLWPNEWKILVSCMMLNCTSRKQAQKVIKIFFAKWPSAEDIIKADDDEIEQQIACLGFKKRRTKNIKMMSKAYIQKSWIDARELPGIGEYAARSWEIFCKNDLGHTAPKDHALVKYWNWRTK